MSNQACTSDQPRPARRRLITGTCGHCNGSTSTEPSAQPRGRGHRLFVRNWDDWDVVPGWPGPQSGSLQAGRRGPAQHDVYRRPTGLRSRVAAERHGRSHPVDDDFGAAPDRAERDVPGHYPPRPAGQRRPARRSHRRVRSPAAAHQRARSARRAPGSRAADPRSARPRSVPPRRATRARSSWPRARWPAPSSRCQKNEMIPKINAEKNTQRARAGPRDAEAAEGHLTISSGRPPTPTCGSSASAAIAPRTRCGRRRPTPSGWRSSRRSAAWRPEDRLEVATTWRRFRRVRKSAPACRSWTSSIRTPCASAPVSTRRTSTSCAVGQSGAGRARRLSRAHFPGQITQISPARHDLVALAEGAAIHRPDRRRRRASEPDAGPDRVARRRALADAGRAGGAARRDPPATASGRSSACSAAAPSRSARSRVGAMNAHEAVVRPASRRARSSRGTSRAEPHDEPRRRCTRRRRPRIAAGRR